MRPVSRRIIEHLFSLTLEKTEMLRKERIWMVFLALFGSSISESRSYSTRRLKSKKYREAVVREKSVYFLSTWQQL